MTTDVTDETDKKRIMHSDLLSVPSVLSVVKKRILCVYGVKNLVAAEKFRSVVIHRNSRRNQIGIRTAAPAVGLWDFLRHWLKRLLADFCPRNSWGPLLFTSKQTLEPMPLKIPQLNRRRSRPDSVLVAAWKPVHRPSASMKGSTPGKAFAKRIYKPADLDAKGVFHSNMLPGVWIDPDWFSSKPLPTLLWVMRKWKLIK